MKIPVSSFLMIPNRKIPAVGGKASYGRDFFVKKHILVYLSNNSFCLQKYNQFFDYAIMVSRRMLFSQHQIIDYENQ